MRAQKPYKQYTVDHTVFNTITDESAYWLGFLITDGSVVYPKGGNFLPKISFELQARDKEQVQELSNFIKSTYPLYYNKNVDAWKLQVASKELADILATYNIVSNKTHIAKVPDSLMNNRHFWRGVMDGDGSFQFDGSYELTSASKIFMEQFIDFVKTITPTRLNSNGTSRATSLRVGEHKGSFRVGTRNSKFLLHLYRPGDLALPRKMAIVDKLRENNNYVYIV